MIFFDIDVAIGVPSLASVVERGCHEVLTRPQCPRLIRPYFGPTHTQPTILLARTTYSPNNRTHPTILINWKSYSSDHDTHQTNLSDRPTYSLDHTAHDSSDHLLARFIPNWPSYSPENLLTQQSSSSAVFIQLTIAAIAHTTQIDPPTQPT